MNRNTTAEKITGDCRQHFNAINDTLYILSGKWKIMIIACLAAFGKSRFMQLQNIIDGVGPKMLSKELRELEINGLITRKVLDTKPVTVEYELTAYGRTLKPITDEMASWGKQHKKKIIREISAR